MEGTNTKLLKVICLKIFTWRHTVLNTDLKMHIKRLSNEANAKQLTLDKPSWQSYWGEKGGFLSQRGGPRKK